MFIFPVPKEKDNSYFMLVCQNQEKSFILTYLEDFRAKGDRANPYLVLTCFDEVVKSKGLALMRGDIISHMSKAEGTVILNQIMDAYMIDENLERVRQFNHEPQKFDYQAHTDRSIADFRAKQALVDKAFASLAAEGKGPQTLMGAQSHSKANRPMIPGGGAFIQQDIDKYSK